MSSTNSLGASADVAAIKAKTDNLPASPGDEVTNAAIDAKTTNLPATPGDESTNVAIKAKTDNLPPDPADASVITGQHTNLENDHTALAGMIAVLTGYHGLPGVDDVTNALIRDVIGNKTDTVAGTSLMALIKLLSAYGIKIDNAATLGLLGTSNSLGYRTEEIEKHFHNQEKWFGLAGTPNGEIHRADLMDGLIQPFALLSGASAFGNWVQILGSSDTPFKAAQVKYDLHRAMITTTNSTNAFIIQIATGESAGLATKITAKDYSSFPYIASTNQSDSGISDIIDPREGSGEKHWARCACVGASAKTINCYFGLHEYVG